MYLFFNIILLLFLITGCSTGNVSIRFLHMSGNSIETLIAPLYIEGHTKRFQINMTKLYDRSCFFVFVFCARIRFVSFFFGGVEHWGQDFKFGGGVVVE